MRGATHSSRGCGADALQQQAVDVVDVSAGTKCAHFGFGHSTCMIHVVGDSGLAQTLGLFALNVRGRRLAMRGGWLGRPVGEDLGLKTFIQGHLGPQLRAKRFPGGASKRADHVLAKRTFDQTPRPPRFERPMAVSLGILIRYTQAKINQQMARARLIVHIRRAINN